MRRELFKYIIPFLVILVYIGGNVYIYRSPPFITDDAEDIGDYRNYVFCQSYEDRDRYLQCLDDNDIREYNGLTTEEAAERAEHNSNEAGKGIMMILTLVVGFFASVFLWVISDDYGDKFSPMKRPKFSFFKKKQFGMKKQVEALCTGFDRLSSDVDRIGTEADMLSYNYEKTALKNEELLLNTSRIVTNQRYDIDDNRSAIVKLQQEVMRVNEKITDRIDKMEKLMETFNQSNGTGTTVLNPSHRAHIVEDEDTSKVTYIFEEERDEE